MNKKVILPFIDEVLLKSTINGLSISEVGVTLLELLTSYLTIITFSQEEAARNKFGSDILTAVSSHALLSSAFEQLATHQQGKLYLQFTLSFSFTVNLSGTLYSAAVT